MEEERKEFTLKQKEAERRLARYKKLLNDKEQII